MLPPGHFAGGYLTAKALLHFFHPAVTPAEYNQLVLWGMFFAFAPDLDTFYWFAKSGALKADPAKGNHRKYYSHAPILWLALGLIIFLLSTSPFWKAFGLLVWLCSWSHFLLDTIQNGIMWLWPLNNKVYAIFSVKNESQSDAVLHEAIKQPFFSYWITFVKQYYENVKITTILEIILVIVTLIIYFLHR